MTATIAERLARRTRAEGECIIWTGALQTNGYGSMGNGQGGSMLVHRAAWEIANGPIPGDLTIDHLCRVKACVNPAHMELVTRGENSRRGRAAQEACAHGHPLSGDNLRLQIREDGRTYRICIACSRRYLRESYDRNYKPTSGKRRAKRSAYRIGATS